MAEQVSYPSRGLKVAAHLYKPQDFSQGKKYAAIIIGHPASSVKEQTASIYANHLAKSGFIALTFDATYQGKSEGQPRNLEDPSARVQDFRASVDYLVTLKFVDENKIGALGICASGGYVINATMTERRIKAVGTVVGVNLGRLYREGNIQEVLEEVGKQRTIQARGGQKKKVNWVPNSPQQAQKLGITEIDVLGAVDYYTTPRGKYETAPNLLHFTSRGLLANWDAFHFIEKLLVQPLQVIVGDVPGAFGSYRDGFLIYDNAASKEKNIHVVKGACHYDLYDQPKPVEQALSKLVPFYQKYL